MKEHKFGKRSKENLSGVKPEVVKLCKKALRYSTVDFSIIDGLRTPQQQREMYDAGKSELDGTNKISDHQTGYAVDVIPVVKGNVWDTEDLEVRSAWLELYRAFMLAGRKLGLNLEFGLGYDIAGCRDFPHISVKH